MNNNFDKFYFPNMFDIHISPSQNNHHFPETQQHVFNETNHNSNKHIIHHHQQQETQDDRTQDQVMNNLSFSIEDLLSKITKVRQQYEVPAPTKIIHKKQQPVQFKISNLSNSTQSNSNHSRSDRYIERFQNQLSSSIKRGSEPRKQVLTSSQRNVKIVLPKSQIKEQTYNTYQERYDECNLTKNISTPQTQAEQTIHVKPPPQLQKKIHSQNLPFGGVSLSQKAFSQYNHGFGKSQLNNKQIFMQNQNSAFGQAPEFHRREQKKSFILQDQVSKNKSSYQQLPIQLERRVNSLFDGKIIREVAASTIFESPDKNKNKGSIIRVAKSPFLDIAGKTDTVVQSKIIQTHKAQTQMPTIKINGVQNKMGLRKQSNLSIRDFHLGRQLGSGKFGDVYQAIHKKTGMLYAIKKIFKSTILEYNMVQQFTRQLKIHYMLDYPNIIKLYTHFDDEYHIFLVMEYGEGGMLMEKLKTGQKFASNIVQQMLRAVEYLQNKKIAHRDIKPQNIVMMFGDTAKLCDFGWSRVFDSDMKKTFCGTLDYVSPQMKDIGQYSLKIDIWSLGVLTFEIICGYAPFKNQINNWKLKGGNLNQKWNWNIIYPPQVSSVAQSFMRNLLKQNPNQRANIRFCMNHLFIRKYNTMNFDQEEHKRFQEIGPLMED